MFDIKASSVCRFLLLVTPLNRHFNPLLWWHVRRHFQVNRPVATFFESGPAEDRASAEGTSGGEYERGMPPLVRGVRGISPEKILIYGCL